MAIVTFVAADFKVIYPEFTSVADVLLQSYFDRATLYLANTDNSMVSDISQRTMLLYLLVAHIASLRKSCGQGLVGRVSSATEGSVSVSADYPTQTNALAAWLTQTQYGAEFWAATAKYRTFGYVPSRRCC